TGKPLFLAVNKVDSVKQESLANDFHGLGIREIFPISAEHGRGIDDLLDAVVSLLTATNLSTATETDAKDKVGHGQSKRSASRARKSAKSESPPFPEKGKDGAPADLVLSPDERRMMHDGFAADEQRTTDDDPAEVRESVAESDVDSPTRETRVAIIGHPNVGKSTLLNRLTGADRAIVSPVPGTTRDAVDEIVERDGKTFRFIDTAGIRRKGKTHLMAEKLSVVMARKHLEAADIALLVIDATEGVSQLDAAIAGYAHESGRSVIIVVNKWDLVISGQKQPVSQAKTARIQESKRPADRAAYEQRLRYGLKFLSYAPVLFISATNGKGAEKILPMLEKVASERRKRIPTAEMNRFLKQVDFDRASVPASKRVKIYYMTQAAVAPPTFILFTDRKVRLHFSYQRFLENQIRRAFGFLGTPIWIKNRARD